MSPSASLHPWSDELADVLLQFFEAAVHTLLKARAVYAPTLFENKRLFGIPVATCRHPGVCTYVGSVLGCVKVRVCVRACGCVVCWGCLGVASVRPRARVLT